MNKRAAIGVFLAAGVFAQAATMDFTGKGRGTNDYFFWSDAGNWSEGLVPGEKDNARLRYPHAGKAGLDEDQTVGGFTLHTQANGRLSGTHTLTVSGYLNMLPGSTLELRDGVHVDVGNRIRFKSETAEIHLYDRASLSTKTVSFDDPNARFSIILNGDSMYSHLIPPQQTTNISAGSFVLNDNSSLNVEALTAEEFRDSWLAYRTTLNMNGASSILFKRHPDNAAVIESCITDGLIRISGSASNHTYDEKTGVLRRVDTPAHASAMEPSAVFPEEASGETTLAAETGQKGGPLITILAHPHNPAVIEDFESGSLPEWELEGSAFRAVDSSFKLFNKTVAGVQGGRFVISGDGSYSPQGTARSPEFVIEKNYINFWIGGTRTWPDQLGARLLVDGQVVRSAAGRYAIAANTRDLYPNTWDVRALKGKTGRIELVDRIANGLLQVDDFVQSDQPIAPATDATVRFNESLRPQFHYSPPDGWMGDPNGLFYYDGIWHLFCQYQSVDAMKRTWGYAVSTNLVYWIHEPPPLPKDPKDAYLSGGCAVDWNNTLGMQIGSQPPFLAFVTHAPYGGGAYTPWMLYSSDAGDTWHYGPDNPLFDAEDNRNRDPVPFFYKPTGEWFLLYHLSNNNNRLGSRIGLYRSANLKEWELIQEFDTLWECPDMYELPVDGDPDNTRWVLCEGSGAYLVGTFDGRTFEPETPLIECNWGGNFYALQTFEDGPDGRRVQLGWMNTGKPNDPGYPGMPFNHQMSFPNELTLRVTPEGIRQFSWPVKEIETLYERETVLENIAVEGIYTVEGVQAELLDVTVRIDPKSSDRVGLILRGQKIIYDAEKQTLAVERADLPTDWYGETLPSNLDKNAEKKPIPAGRTDGTLELRILLDRASVEIYVNNGEHYFAFVCFPDPDETKLEVFAEGGTAEIENLSAWELRSALHSMGE